VQSHLPEKFDVASHHHHQPGSAGAQCVNYHMPTKNYMAVDARCDHSMRMPRPIGRWLSVRLMPAPNGATTGCPMGRQTVANWYPKGRQTIP
jgi:hypothetical protein